MLRLALPWMFLLLPLPWLVRHWLPAAGSGGRALKVPFLPHLTTAAAERRTPLGLRPGMAHLIWLLVVCAAANPQWIGDPDAQPTTGRDLMLVIDVSGSMRTIDFEVDGEGLDRLSMVKAVAGRFIERRTGDRLGLILFGARPYLRAPLTLDRRTVGVLLAESEIALAGEYTALGDAIGLAVKRMRDRPSDSRVIVALTDGANNTGDLPPRQAARLAAAEGIRIYTIGIGNEDTAAPNPYGAWSAGGAGDFNREVLEEVAGSTGGRYLHALDGPALEAAYAQLDRLEPTLGDAIWDYVATPLYPWPLTAALVLSLLYARNRITAARPLGKERP